MSNCIIGGSSASGYFVDLFSPRGGGERKALSTNIDFVLCSDSGACPRLAVLYAILDVVATDNTPYESV